MQKHPTATVDVEIDGKKYRLKTHLMVDEYLAFSDPDDIDDAFKKTATYMARLEELFRVLGEIGKTNIKGLGNSAEAREAMALIQFLGFSGQQLDINPLFNALGAYIYEAVDRSRERIDQYVGYLLGLENATFTVEEKVPQIRTRGFSKILQSAEGVCLDGCGHSRTFRPHKSPTEYKKITKLEGEHRETIKRNKKTEGFSKKEVTETVSAETFPAFEEDVVKEVYQDLREKSEEVRKTPGPLARAIIKNSLRAIANEAAGGREVIPYGPWTFRAEGIEIVSGYMCKEGLEEARKLGRILEDTHLRDDVHYVRVLVDESKSESIENLMQKDIFVDINMRVKYDDGGTRAFVEIYGEDSELRKLAPKIEASLKEYECVQNISATEGRIRIDLTGRIKVTYQAVEAIRSYLKK